MAKSKIGIIVSAAAWDDLPTYLLRGCGNQSIFLSEGVNLIASVTVALGMAV
jgi:hypothetical protein